MRVIPTLTSLFLLALVVVPALADNVTTIENTSVIVTSSAYVDEGIFWFIALFAIVFFVIALMRSPFQDLFAMIATLLLGAGAWLAPRVAHYDVTAMLDPRVVNTSNLTVVRESATRVQLVTTAYPEPLLQIVLAVLFLISFVHLIRVLMTFYFPEKEAWET